MNLMHWIPRISGIAGVALLVFAAATWLALRPLPASLEVSAEHPRKHQMLDRRRAPLTVTYQNRWNLHDFVPLHEIPRPLQAAFILAEDKRFYRHHGVDWLARLHAIVQNLRAGEIVRGASTITEQCVRMLHPRPRTFWSRWVETFEAMQLERRFSKADILEFYLNQVPYVGRRRGVVQAARHYFDRDLDTLNLKEMLALAILVRSPSRLDLYRGEEELRRPLLALAQRLRAGAYLDAMTYERLLHEPLELHATALPVQAVHFVEYLYAHSKQERFGTGGRISTTLDARLQSQVQAILDQRLAELGGAGVRNGAVLVADHTTQEVLAWVNGGDLDPARPGSRIDAVTVPRQPGSTLKPLLYALALEKGWTAATLIDDSPLSEAVGVGLHTYHNYSYTHYGPLRLRDALGNSLNIPAVRAIQFTGPAGFLDTLHRLGFTSLTRHPDFYGDGLALGNGEVTLFELVQAYTALAHYGIARPLRLLMEQEQKPGARVFSEATSSLLGDILSDPDARRLEFDAGALLRFPVQTAVKTGTSSDYRDAWAVGFNYRYTVGVWLGNLDQRPMAQITGSTGPALVLRGVFAELNRNAETRPLYLSPTLRKVRICRDSGLPADTTCAARDEWFVAGSEPARLAAEAQEFDSGAPLHLSQPAEGMQMALDPRIPDDSEVFMLRLPENLVTAKVEWLMDGKIIGSSRANRFPWQVTRGPHTVRARVWQEPGQPPRETDTVSFVVK